MNLRSSMRERIVMCWWWLTRITVLHRIPLWILRLLGRLVGSCYRDGRTDWVTGIRTWTVLLVVPWAEYGGVGRLVWLIRIWTNLLKWWVGFGTV